MPLRKVRMLEGLAGKEMVQAGEEILLPEPKAARYVERGIAEYVDKAEGVKPSAPPARRSRKATSKRKSEKR